MFFGISLALIAIFSASASRAALWDVFSGGADWQRNARLMNDPSPLAKDLLMWLSITDTNATADPRALIHFALEHSGWPKLHVFRQRIEDSIGNAGLKPVEIASWFDQNPPRTADGLKAYLSALAGLGQNTRGLAALKKFWQEADLDRKETAALAAQYKKLLSAADHLGRLDYLLWEDRFIEAEYMLPLVDEPHRKLAEACIALGRLSSKSPKLLRAVPAALQGDAGLLYSRLRWRRAMNKDNDAFDLLRHAPANLVRPDLWWRERNILARRAIEKRNFGRAADIIANHGLTSGGDYGIAEWTLGWLDLEFLGHPDKAYQHFEKFYAAANAAVSRSRAAFWLARAAEKMHQDESAANWYKIAAQFPSTFYGQLSYEKLNGPVVPGQFPDDQVLPQEQQEYDDSDLVQVVRLLAQDGLPKSADPFLAKLLSQAKTRADFVLTARLARESGRLHFAVDANKQMQMKTGEFMFKEGYPLLPALAVKQPESALIHAIVHRESMFNAEAGSPAGARGLMQLMPGTARQVSHRIGRSYSADKLTGNPEYNIELGAAYLEQLLNNYDGFYPLAIAAYNAGPSNVSEWIHEFGDPRSKKVNLIDWIEEIPIYETRNYIQRVMESYYMYKLRLGEEPRTILSFH